MLMRYYQNVTVRLYDILLNFLVTCFFLSSHLKECLGVNSMKRLLFVILKQYSRNRLIQIAIITLFI